MDKKNCSACKYSGMEPDDMNLTCGHPDAGTFGLHIKVEPLSHCGWRKFEQHPKRNPNGSLKLWKPRKIYVASSWKNPHQPEIITELRRYGHEVYDFRNPPNKTGFGWRQADPEYVPGEKIELQRYRRILDTEVAKAGYQADMDALKNCDVCVAVLPFGKSASWEYGFAKGMGKECFLIWPDKEEPELMFSDTTMVNNVMELLRYL